MRGQSLKIVAAALLVAMVVSSEDQLGMDSALGDTSEASGRSAKVVATIKSKLQEMRHNKGFQAQMEVAQWGVGDAIGDWFKGPFSDFWTGLGNAVYYGGLLPTAQAFMIGVCGAHSFVTQDLQAREESENCINAAKNITGSCLPSMFTSSMNCNDFNKCVLNRWKRENAGKDVTFCENWGINAGMSVFWLVLSMLGNGGIPTPSTVIFTVMATECLTKEFAQCASSVTKKIPPPAKIMPELEKKFVGTFTERLDQNFKTCAFGSSEVTAGWKITPKELKKKLKYFESDKGKDFCNLMSTNSNVMLWAPHYANKDDSVFGWRSFGHDTINNPALFPVPNGDPTSAKFDLETEFQDEGFVYFEFGNCFTHRPCGYPLNELARTTGNDACCTAENQCALGEGDCDNDFECEGDLVCGDNNCGWGDGDDCCAKSSLNGQDFVHWGMPDQMHWNIGKPRYTDEWQTLKPGEVKTGVRRYSKGEQFALKGACISINKIFKPESDTRCTHNAECSGLGESCSASDEGSGNCWYCPGSTGQQFCQKSAMTCDTNADCHSFVGDVCSAEEEQEPGKNCWYCPGANAKCTLRG